VAASVTHLARKCRRITRGHGSHVDECVALDPLYESGGMPLEHAIEHGAVEEHQDHDFAASEDFCSVLSRCRPGSFEQIAFEASAIPGDARRASSQEIARHGLPHEPKTYKPDVAFPSWDIDAEASAQSSS